MKFEIPEGFRQIEKPPVFAVVKEKYLNALSLQGIYEPEKLFKSYTATAGKLKGRGMVLSLPVKGFDGETMVIRKYYRGGILRFLNPELYLDKNRALKELIINYQAWEQGIPTAEPIASVSVNVMGVFYRCFLITRKLENCVDLPLYLMQKLNKSTGQFNSAKEAVIKTLANKIKLLHDKDFLHGDLNLKNIIISNENPEFLYFIDWDKSDIKNPLSEKYKNSNLLRLCRSMAKYNFNGLPFNLKDMGLLFQFYWNDAKKAARSMAALKYIITPREKIWRVLKK